MRWIYWMAGSNVNDVSIFHKSIQNIFSVLVSVGVRGRCCRGAFCVLLQQTILFQFRNQYFRQEQSSSHPVCLTNTRSYDCRAPSPMSGTLCYSSVAYNSHIPAFVRHRHIPNKRRATFFTFLRSLPLPL